MRLISVNQGFWSCGHDQKFLIPFGIVTTTTPSDNYLYFEFYGNDFAIEGVGVNDYESGIPIAATTFISDGRVLIDGLMTNIYMVRIDVASISPNYPCFYVRVGLNPFPDTVFFQSEAFKIFRFAENDPSLIRIESTYPIHDCLMHDIEGTDSNFFFPITQRPNTYATFSDGAKFRNFEWFYGDVKFSETKFTKTFEGFYNTHTRTSISETYELFLNKMPDWYAKELSNVLGGSNVQLWNNNRRVSHQFECNELTLQQEKKMCMVLPANVKLHSTTKTVLVGCEIETVLGATISQACANFLNINANTFLVEVEGDTTIEVLLVQLNLGYAAHVVFQMYGYRTDDAGTRFEEHLIDFVGVTEIDVNFLALFGSFDSLVYRSAAEGGVEDFDVVWVFKVTVEKPVGCDTSSYLGYNFRTLNFRTYIHRNITTGSTTVTMPLFQNKEISIL